jgi:hypothetical protein
MELIHTECGPHPVLSSCEPGNVPLGKKLIGGLVMRIILKWISRIEGVE